MRKSRGLLRGNRRILKNELIFMNLHLLGFFLLHSLNRKDRFYKDDTRLGHKLFLEQKCSEGCRSGMGKLFNTRAAVTNSKF